MIKVEELQADGFQAAFRGMRNPLDSWDKSDSQFGFWNAGEFANDRMETVAEDWIKFFTKDTNCGTEFYNEVEENVYNRLEEQGIFDVDNVTDNCRFAFIGPKDMELAERLISAGTEHCKFLRQITVSMDIIAPLYW